MFTLQNFVSAFPDTIVLEENENYSFKSISWLIFEISIVTFSSQWEVFKWKNGFHFGVCLSLMSLWSVDTITCEEIMWLDYALAHYLRPKNKERFR